MKTAEELRKEREEGYRIWFLRFMNAQEAHILQANKQLFNGIQIKISMLSDEEKQRLSNTRMFNQLLDRYYPGFKLNKYTSRSPFLGGTELVGGYNLTW